MSRLRDLDQAEHWFRHSLRLRDNSDRHGRARNFGSLGQVAMERFDDALTAKEAEPVLLERGSRIEMTIEPWNNSLWQTLTGGAKPPDQSRPLHAILEVLRNRPGTCSADDCYEVSPGVWVHRPWAGCTTIQPEADALRKVAVTCWHCQGEKRCVCMACWQAGPGECVTCKGTGQAWRWVQ